MARIKRFGVLKMSYFMGLSGVIFGFIIALLVGIFYSVFVYSLPIEVVESELLSEEDLTFGWLNLIWYPLIYGIMMFLSGLIFTPITNLVLRLINGIDLNIEMKSSR